MDKLRWTFNLYDINQDGVLTRDEICQIVSSIHDLMGKSIHSTLSEKEHTEKVFKASSSFTCFRFRLTLLSSHFCGCILDDL